MKSNARSTGCSAGEPDDALVTAVARGDAAAFRALVDRHMDVVHRVAARMLSDAGEADEVTQDVFLKLWIHAEGWQSSAGTNSLLPWLRKVGTNACLDRLRRRRHMSQQAVPEGIDPGPHAADLIDAHRLGEMAMRTLRGLPDHQRAAIVLTYYENLPNADAAKVLGMRLKAFESLLFRARHAMREKLTALGIGPTDLRDVA